MELYFCPNSQVLSGEAGLGAIMRKTLMVVLHGVQPVPKILFDLKLSVSKMCVSKTM